MIGSIGETFGMDFMRHALVAGILVGAVCGYIGVYVVLRRIVFVGVALAEISSAGVALALWSAGVCGWEVSEHSALPMVGAVGLMLVGVLLFSIRWTKLRVPQESYIGVGYAFAAAAAVLLMAHSAQGEAHMMEMLFGNILYGSVHEIEEFAVAASAVALVHALFAKEFLFTSFDPEMAATIGYRPRRWDVLFFLTLGITIAFAIRLVGVLVVFALLVMPAVTGLFLTRRLQHAFPAAVAAGILPIGAGLYLSYVRDLPSGACIVLVSFLIMVAAGGVKLLRHA